MSAEPVADNRFSSSHTRPTTGVSASLLDIGKLQESRLTVQQAQDAAGR